MMANVDFPILAPRTRTLTRQFYAAAHNKAVVGLQ